MASTPTGPRVRAASWLNVVSTIIICYLDIGNKLLSVGVPTALFCAEIDATINPYYAKAAGIPVYFAGP
jgi:hypothetical protein